MENHRAPPRFGKSTVEQYRTQTLLVAVTVPAQWQGQSLTVQLLAPQDDRVLFQTNLQYQQGSLQL
ncbi:MAG: hypothetical protein ACOVRM_16665, partial [Planctomycetaceae bacterium]